MKFAFVTPRYGADISTGAEHACRLLAQQVSDRHDVDVLTTCARDVLTWKNEYAEGADRVRGVLVRRFTVSEPHQEEPFIRLGERLVATPHSRAEELEWVRRLGPWSPGLIDHITRQQRSYDAIVFFGLWHPATVHGLQIARDRSILFPHVQLRPHLRFGLWRELLTLPRAVGYMSAAERRLVHQYLWAKPHTEEIVGIGIDPPPQQAYPRHQQDPNDTLTADDEFSGESDPAEDPSLLSSRGVPFRRRNRLYGTLAVYGGRVEWNNGCEEMLEYFDSYTQEDREAALVLMGVKMMKVPDEPYLRMPGVLPDRDRMVAYEAADVTIAPASDDLLSQSLLESLAVGTPVLASAANESAVEHCRRANGGLYYANRGEFVEALKMLTSNSRLRETLGESGRRYIQQNFRWERVLGRFDRLVARVKPR